MLYLDRCLLKTQILLLVKYCSFMYYRLYVLILFLLWSVMHISYLIVYSKFLETIKIKIIRFVPLIMIAISVQAIKPNVQSVAFIIKDQTITRNRVYKRCFVITIYHYFHKTSSTFATFPSKAITVTFLAKISNNVRSISRSRKTIKSLR